MSNETDQVTASAAVLRDGAKSVDLVDLAGRRLKVRRLSVLDQSRLSRAVGGENAENRDFMRYATFAVMVAEVNGIEFMMPRTLPEVEAAIERMGDEGYMSVAIQYGKWTKAANDVFTDALARHEADIKNSSGTPGSAAVSG